jgi:polyisoprenoid-binding protein YceI
LIVKIDRNSFKSTNIKSTSSRNYAVTGDLTIRGVTKSVTLTVEDVSKASNDPWEHQRIGSSGSAKVVSSGRCRDAVVSLAFSVQGD